MILPSKHNRIGLMLYEGPSLFDGNPVVVLATGLGKRWRSASNAKTGDMIQTWILRADIHPAKARRTGADRSICGQCPLRGNRGCYVQTAPATMAWKSYRAGRFHLWRPQLAKLVADRRVRLGAYGDPAAVPIGALLPIIAASAGWTGYTHAWASADPAWKHLLMASCDSLQQALAAQSQGWATFRVLRPNDSPQCVMLGETPCPSARGLTCERCGGCRGGDSRPRTIPLHGSPVARRAYLQTIRS